MSYIRVTKDGLPAILEILEKRDLLVFDTETTGLRPYQECRMFSLAISDGENAYYFNFQNYNESMQFAWDDKANRFDNHYNKYVLAYSDLLTLTRQRRTWVAHNAKFDLHFMDKAGIKPHGTIIDTEVLARLFENHHHYTSGGYSLDACVQRWLNGTKKDDRVKQWLDDTKTYSVKISPEGREEKHYHFEKVPFELISTYAMRDAEITYQLYEFLRKEMYEQKCWDHEVACTSVIFEMEKRGVKIDRAYCEQAIAAEKTKIKFAEVALHSICGGDFTDSAKFLAPLLEARGFQIPKTELGNPQVTDQVLNQFPGDTLAKTVLGYRESLKRANTYFANYLALSDEHDAIHTNFRQAGTVTGRMSSNNPNLQNIPAEDDGVFPIRRAFVPREDFCFVSIDYAQMEFRLMLDYANQEDLIEKIKAGHDPHDSTAQLTGLTRKAAKTLNFGLLYGMGIAKLGEAIGVDYGQAKQFKYEYFGALPNVRAFIYGASDRQKAKGFVHNWCGRRYKHETKTVEGQVRDFAYKAANSIIQGGCADICKRAMVKLHDFLAPYRSRMVLQIHDEIVFEIHKSELHIIPSLKELMESAYEPSHQVRMPMSTSVAISTKNLHDMDEVENLIEITAGICG